MNEVENIYGQNIPEVKSTTTEMMVSRQAQEVQAAMVIAKKFPRDEITSYNRIINACKRKTLAEKAEYEYPRGKGKDATVVTGPTIRLAEALAQNWGNLDFGIMELEQKNGESQVMAYCWDLETNTRQCKIFTVPHKRHTKSGDYALTDPRDIYEMVANQGARRLRSCILGVIPGDVVEAAQNQCRLTLQGDGKVPVIDLVRQCTAVLENEFGVPLEAVEKFIGCKAEHFTMQSLQRLKRVYNSLKDGIAKREDYFDLGLPEEELKDPFEDKVEGIDKNKDKKEDKPETVPEDGQEELPFK